MSKWSYYQIRGGEDQWVETLAEQLPSVIAKYQPRFVTVLAVSDLIDNNTSHAEIAALKYYGPLYFDWDAADVAIALEKFQQFLRNLKDLEVDLNAIRMFATGGRGFHVEIPMEMFIAKPPKAGIQALPAIYKEMVFALYTDTMDLRVYSGRKGRMWRTPGVKRENGKYKVPLTPDEALNMEAADYDTLCAAPRQPPVFAAPTLNSQLAVIYAKAEAKVAAAVKRKKDSAVDAKLLTQFKGDYPPSLLNVMAGAVSPDVGFHQIAMQIAITSNALNKSEAQMLERCEGLINNHQSDGNRYNSPAKRKAELVRMFYYTRDNPCYAYSKDAVRKLVPAGTPTVDLDGVANADGAVGHDDPGGFLGGVFATHEGLWVKGENGARMVCDIGFKDVVELKDARSKMPQGFEAEVLKKGRSCGRKEVMTEAFLSKANFQRFAMTHGGTVTNASDPHIASYKSILGDIAVQNDNVVYMLNREGLDVLPRPNCDDDTLDFVWVSPKGVETLSPVKYMFRGNPTKVGLYKTDLMDAPAFKADEETAEVIDALLNMNSPFVMGNLIGWMVSCFHRQIYQHLYKEFPLLALFGAAGSGKSQTRLALMSLFYYKETPYEVFAASGTKFYIEASPVSSASIPCVFEEYKPRSMNVARTEQLRNIFRASYNGGTFGKGAMGTEVGANWRDIRTMTHSAPVMYVSESMETETAIMERSIIVPITLAGRRGRTEYHAKVVAGGRLLSTLGKQLVRATFNLKLPQFKQTVEANRVKARKLLPVEGKDRMWTNIAVVLTGLDFLGEVLKAGYGDRFEAKLNELREAMADTTKIIGATTMSEISKVMDTLAYMSVNEDELSETGLRPGYDYCYHSDGNIDVRVKNVYVKYSTWCKRKGQTSLFDTEAAFLQAMRNYAAVVDKACLDSGLRGPKDSSKIFRLSTKTLREEGVELFKE